MRERRMYIIDVCYLENSSGRPMAEIIDEIENERKSLFGILSVDLWSLSMICYEMLSSHPSTLRL